VTCLVGSLAVSQTRGAGLLVVVMLLTRISVAWGGRLCQPTLFNSSPVYGASAWKSRRTCFRFDLMVVTLIMVKVKIISVLHVRSVRIRLLLRFETPRKNAATKAFHRLISSGLLWVALRWSRIISSSKRKKMIRVTIKESPIMKKAKMTTMGL